jgi:hypothetical protein
MRKLLAFILVLFILSGAPQTGFAQKTRLSKTAAVTPTFGNTDGITAQQLKNYLEFIASATTRKTRSSFFIVPTISTTRAKTFRSFFYMDGSHADYHQPSDSIEKINFEQMERVARSIFAMGWELANRPTRPKVDKPLKLDGN